MRYILPSSDPNCTLHAGDLVEVKSAEEILSSLDADGTYEFLPFMPEMLKFCGRRFRVFKRATKICDTIEKTGFKRMRQTVLLDGVHCDGASHGGCQARCMIFWKEQWLKPVSGESPNAPITIRATGKPTTDVRSDETHSEARTSLIKTTVRRTEPDGESVYRCQITELAKASLPLAWWDLRHYLEDVTSGNRRLHEVGAGILIMLFNWVQRLRGGDVYPHMDAGISKQTPVNPLNLQPGDTVKVKTREEILATLDRFWKNKGLYFDVGMARYCGKTYRVAVRAHNIIHEKTGKMVTTSADNPMIILETVFCNADYQKFCARSEYVFWREIWLEPIEGKSLMP